MADTTLYGFQCCPVRVTPDRQSPSLLPDEDKKEDQRSLDNMARHQEILNEMLVINPEDYFKAQKKDRDGKTVSCLAFESSGKLYPFVVLLPRPGEKGDGIIMLRIAKLVKRRGEIDFHVNITHDEPSALVIIDNRYDQQRILIQHTAAWRDTDTVKNILQAGLNKFLKSKRLVIRIENVWRKNNFWNICRTYGDEIRTFEFDLGYPNMGRTGNKALEPIKAALKNIHASAKITMTAAEKAKKLIVDSSEDMRDPLLEEIALHCAENGLPSKIILEDHRIINLSRAPKAMQKDMPEEERKELYSGINVSISKRIAEFDGQADLFNSVHEDVEDILQSLKDINN